MALGWVAHEQGGVGDCCLGGPGGKEEERAVAVGETELNNEILLMEGDEYVFRLIGEEIEEMRKSGYD